MPRSTHPLEPDELERLRSVLEVIALRALGDVDTAEEAVQETLTRALEALRDGRLKQPDKLGAFVRGIARNVILELKRARRRVTELAEPDARADIGSPDALDTLISQDEEERVRRAMSELAQSDQEILRLSFFEGLTPTEIAERLGEPADRIRKRKSRALARLRRAFPN